MNSVTEFLCQFGGADPQILRKCPKLEVTKYKSQGVLVLVLVVIANITSICSLMLVHSKSVDSPFSSLNTSDIFNAIFMGLCWTFIVHNSYRLILSSTGYGDGNSTIHANELLASIPKLLLASAIGLFSGAAITVITLHTEMDHGLSLQQTNLLQSLNKNVEQDFVFKLDTLYQKQADDMERLSNLEARQVHYANNPQDNKEEQLSIDSDINQIKNEIQQSIIERKAVNQEINRLKLENQERIINSIDFLVTVDKAFERHSLATILIFAFTILIYLAPILIRMIWSKSAYEYLVDFQNYILLSKCGIAPKAHEIKVGDDVVFIDRFTIPEQLLDEMTSQHFIFRKQNNEQKYQYYCNKKSELESKNVKGGK
jgi:hypothetical protein